MRSCSAAISPLGEAESGAEVYLATHPFLEGVTGKFFNVKTESKAEQQAYTRKVRKRLWELSVEKIFRPLGNVIKILLE